MTFEHIWCLHCSVGSCILAQLFEVFDGSSYPRLHFHVHSMGGPWGLISAAGKTFRKWVARYLLPFIRTYGVCTMQRGHVSWLRGLRRRLVPKAALPCELFSPFFRDLGPFKKAASQNVSWPLLGLGRPGAFWMPFFGIYIHTYIHT